jgi:hypothetical protein
MSRLASGAAIHPHQALEAAGLSEYRDGRENAALDEKRDDLVYRRTERGTLT